MSTKPLFSIILVLALVCLPHFSTTPVQADTGPNQELSDLLFYIQQQKIRAIDRAENDLFGYSVAIDGTTALVGAYDDDEAEINQGSVYVLVRAGNTWSQQAKLTAPVPAESENFGKSLAISGDTALVGSHTGAYVFLRSGTTWSFQQQLIPDDWSDVNLYRSSVALSGDTAIVGAPYHEVAPGKLEQGAAFVFVRSGTAWTQQDKLIASDGSAYHHFGWSVAVTGDTVLVGAPRDDIGATVRKGSAYVFVRAGTTWSFQQKLTADDGATGDDFGYSVALDGDIALVGARGDDIGIYINQGSAYGFSRSGTIWGQQAKLTAANGVQDQQFGRSVALSGNIALVGASNDLVDNRQQQGSAYTFAYREGTWNPEERLIATTVFAYSRFGYSVAISGNDILIGVPYEVSYYYTRGGSVYYYQRIDLPPEPTLISPSGTLDGVSAPTFEWNVYPTATAYRLAVYSYSIGAYVILKTVPASDCTSTQCQFPSPVNLKDGRHAWKVLAYTPWGITPYSTFMYFSIINTSLPPPSIPTPISPNGTVDTHRPTFSWQASEHAAFYRLAVFSIEMGDYIFIQNTYPTCTGGICTDTHASIDLLNGDYKFKVQARNGTGMSDYSAWMSFTVLSDLPLAPTLIGPSGMVIANPPTYEWNPVEGATRYYLAVYSNTDGKYIILCSPNPGFCDSGTCSIKFYAKLAAGAYRFKMLAANEYGMGGYSAFMNFTIP